MSSEWMKTVPCGNGCGRSLDDCVCLPGAYRCGSCEDHRQPDNIGLEAWPDELLGLLAVPYRDHEDFQEEWNA